MRRAFEQARSCASRNVKFQYSFRSAPIVLDAVDTVFSREQAFAGLTDDPGATVHQAVRANAPGAVDLWPMIEPDEKRELEGWDAPFDETQETSPRVKLARRIASTIKRWIDRRVAGRRRRQRGATRRATSWCWCASAARCSTRSSVR